MSALFVDSFDHYDTAGLAMKYDTLGSGFAIGAYGRWGSNGFRCLNGNAYAQKGINPGSQKIHFGFAVKFNVSGQLSFCETYSAAVQDRPLVVFTRNTDGSISAWVASDSTGSSGTMFWSGLPVLTTPTGLVNNNVWNYIEIKVDHDDAGSIEIAVNGNTEATISPVDTRPASRICSAIGFGMSASAGTIDFDDFYIADDQGTGVNDFQGDSRIEAIYPESDGTHLDWTPNTGSAHWSLVNETVSDEDTEYVATTTPGDQDSYNYQTVSGAGDIIAVQVNMIARKEASGTKKVKALVRTGGADFLSTEEHAVSMAYEDYRAVFETNPDTAAAWTPAEVNASEFGMEVTL